LIRLIIAEQRVGERVIGVARVGLISVEADIPVEKVGTLTLVSPDSIEVVAEF
jgi:hypothetical protein